MRLAECDLVRKHECCHAVGELDEIHAAIQIIDFTQNPRPFEEPSAAFAVPYRSKQPAPSANHPAMRIYSQHEKRPSNLQTPQA
jgi:hypothetical protein